MPEIAPSILSADFLNLDRDIRAVQEAGCRLLHLDVMDGHFVPNLSFGLPLVKAIRKEFDLTLDVHLMISNPELMAERYVEAGADMVSVHYEACLHLDRLLNAIRDRGAEAGVVLNPHTPVTVLEDTLDCCDFVLIMSVNPGYGGQKFIVRSFDKVRKVKDLIQSSGFDVKIEIDGGIGPENAEAAVRAGVDIIVAGSAIFGSKDAAGTFRQMKDLAQKAGAEGTEQCV